MINTVSPRDCQIFTASCYQFKCYYFIGISSSYLVGGPQVLDPDLKALSHLWQVWVDKGPQHWLLWILQTLKTQHLHQSKFF